MKKQLSSLLFVLFLGFGVSAQTTEKSVEKIRSYYNDVAEKARLAQSDEDRGQYGDLFVNELKVNSRNHQWRAVGIYSQNYKFYYRSLDTEDHMYPDQLVFVVSERTSSARKYREEYLFSASGELVFYFFKAENSDEKPSEVRIYYSGAKAIRLIEDKKTRDRLSAEDVKTVNRLSAFSRKIKEAFKQSIAI
jgi:hypothetical protein